jgi:hypothetical protein
MLSEEVTIDQLRSPAHHVESPRLRLLLCTGCGAIGLFLARLEELESYDVRRLFATKLRAAESQRGPYR